jgi:hypothetical protein
MVPHHLAACGTRRKEMGGLRMVGPGREQHGEGLIMAMRRSSGCRPQAFSPQSPMVGRDWADNSSSHHQNGSAQAFSRSVARCHRALAAKPGTTCPSSAPYPADHPSAGPLSYPSPPPLCPTSCSPPAPPPHIPSLPSVSHGSPRCTLAPACSSSSSAPPLLSSSAVGSPPVAGPAMCCRSSKRCCWKSLLSD